MVNTDRKIAAIATCDVHLSKVRAEKYSLGNTVRRLCGSGDDPASLESPVSESAPLPMPQSKPKRRRSAEVPRCLCGCRRAARWPHDGAPLFYARLCAYEMMVAQLRAEKAGGGA
jgi:hypothetical protein